MLVNWPLALDFAPWRLSGTVIAPALNDPAALAALGDAVHRPPYKAPPVAPVLYLKPRHTQSGSGACVPAPPAGSAWTLGASLALVVGRPACRVAEHRALEHVAGWTLVADLALPLDSFYRPAVRLKARDGSCLIGPRVVPAAAVADPGAVVLQLGVDDRPPQPLPLGCMQRSAARLIQDVSEFMTLHAGDLLLLGVAAQLPQLLSGQRFSIDCAAIGRLHGSVA